jgi:long-chain acyl-CoA synthetase
MLDSTAVAFGGIRSDDIIQVAEPQVHVSGFIASLTVLLGGGTVVLLDTYEEARYVAAMRRWHPTLICTHDDVLAKLSHWPDIRSEDFSSLRGAYTGGERVPEDLRTRFRALSGLAMQVGYGLTEAIWLTLCPEPKAGADECLGRPIDGVALRVADADGHQLPDGEVGELLVQGPMVMRGYWRDPDQTTKALEGGWLRTGDSGWRDTDGDFWFTARLKELIVRNTSKISPGEVEAALDAHASVSASGVVGVPDRDEGEVPIAFVVLEPGRTANEAELLAFLQTRIAEYKIPTRVHFVEDLPLTRSGKLDHLALRAAAAGDARPTSS